MRTAEASHVSGDRLAKGIVLRRDGGYMLVVLPASPYIRLGALRAQLGGDVEFDREDEIYQTVPRRRPRRSSAGRRLLRARRHR